MKKLKVLAFLLASILLISDLAYGANSQDLLDQQKQLEQQMGQKQSEINNVKNQKNSVEAQLDKINDKIADVQKSILNANNKIIQNEQKITVINSEIDTINKKSEKQKELLETRLKVYYEYGNVSYLDVLLNSKSITDFLDRVEIVKDLVGSDKEIIAQMQQIKQELDGKKQELETAKSEALKSKQEYESVKQDYATAKNEKNKVMQQLTAEQRRIEKEYEDLEDASNRIAQEIQRIQGGSSKSPYTGGKFGWPTPGYTRISSSYGYRIHPILKVKKLHTGMDIAAPKGANMVAAGDGTIINSSYISGYGNTVIIDHGGGISTLYAHNDKLLAKVGQKVKRGDVISKVGSTGNSTGPHAHFEVRINGSPVDPLPYLK